MKSEIFWNKVRQCKHENLYSDYAEPLPCLCGGYEYHRKDCEVYFTDCSCGEQYGFSGWPGKRWLSRMRRSSMNASSIHQERTRI